MYNFIQQSILNKSNKIKMQLNPENIFMENHMEYITARSLQNYIKHLFPSFTSEKQLLLSIKNKKLLDLGSGLNHMVKSSLITKMNKEPNSWSKGLDIVDLPRHNNYIKASLYKIPLLPNSVNIIVSQYVLYSHINSIKLIKKAFTEIYRILTVGGEARIYPVYFGNYYFGNNNFKLWILQRFSVNIIQPKFHIDNNKKKCNLPCKGKYKNFSDSYIMEKIRHHVMDVKTIVLTKI